MARPSKDMNAVRKAREEAEKHLQEVVKGLKQDRELVVKYLDAASFIAAKTAVETVSLTAIDKLDLDIKKLRHDAALKILKINGFEIERSENTSNVRIQISDEQASKIQKARLLTGDAHD